MISPEQRSMLTDALTPPDGYRFDCGVATTYSLDLITLLTLPLHLARRDTEDVSPDRPDPLPVLEALRRMGDRLTVFCQRGRLQIPRKANALLGLLESMVHEAQAPHGGVFHPKVWLLRFEPGDANHGEAAMLRMLVLTRNLTDDRSWDLSLWLEGKVGKKKLNENKSLVRFIERVCEMSTKAISATRSEQIQLLSTDVHRTVWEPPGQYEWTRFHALGIEQKAAKWLPEADGGLPWDELGVVSPFVTQDTLSELAASAKEPLFLVSRSEELDKLSSLEDFSNVHVLSDQAVVGDLEDDDSQRQRGLHAKVYIGRRTWYTHLFVGSANATAAALKGRNVEFMVELIGRTSKVGTPADWVGNEGLGPLLVPYSRSDLEDPERLADERELEKLRDALARADLSLHCSKCEEGWAVDLHGLNVVDYCGVKAHAWLVTQDEERAVSIGGEPSHVVAHPVGRLGIFAPHHVTSFTGFGLAFGAATLRFAMQLPLHGGPEDRDLEILRAAIRNREGLIRYLMLLLGDWSGDEGNEYGAGALGEKRALARNETPLFEMLARAFAREPDRLTRVHELVKRLRDETTEDDPILTDDFIGIWSVFEHALSEEEGK
ncbi:phospholipase D family protein [Paraburkholderia edwinii]|uniref:Phospholipase D family protein n=1 Tax=Paraburkholderia edwinii TaxID=2861782 RepID=A0ABX8UQ08_9BURK|nr:phospholipase D family protein [Paraburkholderia edwinii]QYD69023.1 phospholipase D family protein [Paraburkholderia edwinii]